MRTGAPAGHRGFYHETGFYGSDDELLALVVPFITGGIAAGEPTLVVFDAPNTRTVRRTLGDVKGVTFLDAADQYTRPAATVRSYRDLLAGFVAAGARQIRVVGDVPHPGVGASWEAWARYEAVINHAYADYPLWGLCPYDTRTTPIEVLAEVERTHPHVAAANQRHLTNDRYQDPAAFLRSRPPAPADPVEAGPPLVLLLDPSPGDARRAVAAVAEEVGLAAPTVADLVLATSEVVTNAAVHGSAPVLVRAWGAPERVVVSVTDAGRGPADPFAGLLHTTGGTGSGGYGLWFAHQLCADVSLAASPEGFTVRLVAGPSELTPVRG